MRMYGRLSRDPLHGWKIECEPQVAVRFKRVFTKVKQGAKFLTLADTAENARELAWFLERYPMEMSDGDRSYLGQRDAQHRQLSERIAHVLSADYQPREFKLALPLREYQKVGAELTLHTGGLVLVDEMGLGKTAQAIAVIADPERRPALVCTLTHLCSQWKAELERFLPGVRVHVLKGTRPYDVEAAMRREQYGRRHENQRQLFEPNGLPDVLVCNYQKLHGWAPALAGKVNTVIFDEGHELRHSSDGRGSMTNKYWAAKHIADLATCRMALTGTPVFNSGSEFFNVTEVIKPGALGNQSEFKTEWCDEAGNVKDTRAFGSFLREIGLMLRRTREDVGRELPALTIIPHVFQVDFKEINRMTGDAAELARTILQQGGMGIDKLKAAEEFSWRLRQATGIAKAPLLAEFVRMLVESGERVLLGGWHHEVYKLLGEQLKDLEPVFFTGEESVRQKEEAKTRFVEGSSKVLIMSVRAGAGIDGLQHVCRTVVIGEPDWSPSVHEQFICRVHRDGQTHPVFAYFPLANCGSDPVIADVLNLKRAQLEGIRDPNIDVLARSQVDPERMKRLAADFLRQRGERSSQLDGESADTPACTMTPTPSEAPPAAS